MRIAFIVNRFPLLSETFILNQIVGCIDRGHEVDVYGIKPADLSKLHPDVVQYNLLERTYYRSRVPEKRIKEIAKGIKLLLADGFKHPAVAWRSLNPGQYCEPPELLSLLYAAMPSLGKAPYDIIHCQFGNLGLLGMALRDIGAIQGKLITTFRGNDISEYVRQHGEHVYDRLFQTGDFFLTNCDFFRNRLLKLGCHVDRVLVHRSGIDCDRFFFQPRRLSPGEQVRIVTTGRLVEKKGIEYVVRAIAKLSKTYPNIKYDVIGDGPLRGSLEQLIQTLNVRPFVELLGWKQERELIEILDRSHIMVAPSISSRNGDQDAPVNVLKEAMAMGLPVIGTQHGGIPELVEDGKSGFLVAERDVEALSDRLEFLVTHPDRWIEMGKAGRAYVEAHYNKETLNDRLVEIYQTVLA
ncbi:MAG: colanic acid biosynthesis glycosyltransferase WcaL [Leptolyngbyaceae cyanobacterium RM1_406_9]|nr:colanic acid biosynthesis glycosyltransferase WcaL [Leptolyngbyaceae cyanobacterium RM1_406_9]